MSSIELAEIASQHLSAPVQYAILTPHDAPELPMCILLFGGGGTREALFDLQPLFEKWWGDGGVLPMRIATPTAELDYYMEEPNGAIRWDSFVIADFIPHLRSQFALVTARLPESPRAGMGRSK